MERKNFLKAGAAAISGLLVPKGVLAKMDPNQGNFEVRTVMTLADWKSLNLPVQWSMYTNTRQELDEIWKLKDRKEVDKRLILDLYTSVPDGVYEGIYGYDTDEYDLKGLGPYGPYVWYDKRGKVVPSHKIEESWRERRSGIVVKDNQFVPEPTADCIYQMVRRTERYIRGEFEGQTVRDGDHVHHKWVEKIGVVASSGGIQAAYPSEISPETVCFRISMGS